MEIKCIAGFSVITKQPNASASLYQETLGLPLERLGDYPDYLFVDKFPGANHFGVWPLKMAAQSCFGQDEWPAGLPEPTATVEFELADAAAVEAAVQELKAKGQNFIHEVRTEPCGQISARFIRPEGVRMGGSSIDFGHDGRRTPITLSLLRRQNGKGRARCVSSARRDGVQFNLSPDTHFR